MMVVRVAPTRDGHRNPAERLPDKLTRLLCGRTLDEWWAIQSWASKHISQSILVGETPEHEDAILKTLRAMEPGCPGVMDRLTVIVRPETMNHPTQDSGSFPCRYGYEWAKSRLRNINILMTDFVVSPLRMPGDLDRLVEEFAKKLASPNPDAVTGVEFMTSFARTEGTFYGSIGDRALHHYRIEQTGNLRYAENWTTMNTFCAMTPRFYEASHVGAALQLPQYMDMHPWRFEVEPWQEVHIDYEWEWELAEHLFEKHIGGIEAYEHYRRSWYRTGS